MRAYVIATGVVFGLLIVVHVIRAIAEGPVLFKQPSFLLITLAAAGLLTWAISLIRKSGGGGQ